MVSIVPQDSPIELISKMTGQGIAQNLPGGVQRGMEMGMYRQGIDQALADPNLNPAFKQALILSRQLGTTAQGQQLLGQMLPRVIGSAAANDVFGQGQPGTPGQPQPMGQPQGQGMSAINNMMQGQPQVQPQPQANQGFFPSLQNVNSNQPMQQPAQGQQQQGAPPMMPGMQGLQGGMNPQELMNLAKTMAIRSGDPNSVTTWQDFLMKGNEEVRKQREDSLRGQQIETERQADVITRDTQKRNLAQQYLPPGTSPEKLNDFMLIGNEFNSIEDPKKWLEKTRQKYDEFNRIRTSIDTSFVPGVIRGLFMGGEEREKDLDMLSEYSQLMKKYGKETEARDKLASLSLSPTEVEIQFNPVEKETRAKISRLPQGKIPPTQTMTQQLKKKGYFHPTPEPTLSPEENEKYSSNISDFLIKNLGDQSVLGLRDELINKKHYGWRQYYQGLREAMQNGLVLNPAQQNELIAAGQPPMQDMASIFRDFGNIIPMLRGAK